MIQAQIENPTVKGIQQEVKEMHENPSDDFMSLPLEDKYIRLAIRN